MRIAHIKDNKIINVSIGETLPPNTENDLYLEESDALSKNYTYFREIPTYKIWDNAIMFWESFNLNEQLLLANSNDPILNLMKIWLSIWKNEIWSNDPRVENALNKAEELGLITTERKNEILT